MGLQNTALVVSFAVALYYAFIRPLARSRNPPGPKPWPIIGNMFDFPTSKAWLTCTKWREQYGNIIYMDILGQPIVILNSLEDCIELLDKRSAKYSDRPHSVMVEELMGWGSSFATMQYGPRWRRHRRLFHQHFTENACAGYHAFQQRTTIHLLQRLLEKPQLFKEHARLAFGKNILGIVYDIPVESHDNVYLQNAEESVQSGLEAGIPGRFLVDVFPILKHVPSWFPGAGFQRKAAEWKKIGQDTQNLPFQYVMEQTEKGIAKPTIMSSMLAMAARDGIVGGETPEEAVKGCTSMSYVAGADTMYSSMQAMFAAMANYPLVQKKAQGELDKVLGEGRLPTFEDRPHLPYISAVVNEVLRWHSITPLGLPHCLLEDDEYKGYILRKGTVVMANVWHIMHDPDVYDNPMEFDPMRWLIETPEGLKANPDIMIPEPSMPFGFGRRTCPGRHFALDSMFITISNILACFTISPLDEHGTHADNIIEDVTDGLISYPVPFKVSVVPRSSEVARLIGELDSES